MSFFNRFKKKKVSRPPLPPGIDRNKLAAMVEMFLNDENMQNSFYRDTAGPELFPHCVKKGPTPDELPEAEGEFGRSPNNPILCNGPIGEAVYLSKLVLAETKEKVFFHRLGSFSGKGDCIVDGFELISMSGNFYDMLYLNMYYPGKSKKTPKGYNMLKKISELRGSTSTCSNFPKNLYEEVDRVFMNMIPLPVADNDIKNIDFATAEKTIKQHKEMK